MWVWGKKKKNKVVVFSYNVCQIFILGVWEVSDIFGFEFLESFFWFKLVYFSQI